MTSQTSPKWRMDSCEAITCDNHSPLVPRGGLRAPIVWGDGVVRDAAIGVGMGEPIVFSICGLGQKIHTRPPIRRSYEEDVYAQRKGKLTHCCYKRDGMARDTM